MKKQLLLASLLAFLFFNACKKDKEEVLIESPSIDHTTEQATGLNNTASNWVSPSNEQLNHVWINMMDSTDYIEGLNFIYLNGVFDWNEALLVKSKDENNFLISIPTIISDRVVSVLFTSVVNNTVTYFHVPLSLLQKPTEEIVELIGIEKAMLAVTIFTAHEQHFGDYMSVESVGHLHSELMASATTSAVPRGWCLIEIIIWNPSNEDDYTSKTTEWVSSDKIYFEPKQGSALHGQNINNEYTLYRFWAWCPDGQNQSGWDFNLGERIGGGIGSLPTLPDWTYYGNKWFEENDDCMFYFGGMAEAEFRALEEDLLASSCGDAAAYAIQNTMANVINGRCSETNGDFPPQLYDVEETINEIRSQLSDNMIFEMGQLICETCAGNAACLGEMAECGTENHEACVRIKAFLINNPGIQLTGLEIVFLEHHLDRLAEIEAFLVDRTDLDSEAKELAVEVFLQLLTTDPDFEELVNEWPAFPSFLWPFIKEVGVELAVELFQKLAQKYAPSGQLQDVIDAVGAVAQGDFLDFAGEVFDIVKKKFPAGALVDMGIESYDLYKRARPVWTAVSKMEQFGGEVIEKFLNTVVSHAGGVLGKFKWKSNSVGAELVDLVNPDNFWSDFKDLFPDIKGPFPNPTQPLEQTYRVLNETIELKFYPVSNTTQSYTLSIRIRPSGKPFKIRFL